MRRRATMSSVVALLATLVMAPAVAVAADGSVRIEGFAFRPGSVTVRAGDTVTWTNEDGVGHTATGDGWDTGVIGQGSSASVRFEEPGTYAFICSPHPSMTGTVVVQAASTGGGGGSVTPPPADAVATAGTGSGSISGLATAALAAIFVLALVLALVALPRRRAQR